MKIILNCTGAFDGYVFSCNRSAEYASGKWSQETLFCYLGHQELLLIIIPSRCLAYSFRSRLASSFQAVNVTGAPEKMSGRIRQLACLELLTICRHSLQWFSHLLLGFSNFILPCMRLKTFQMQLFLISKEGCHPSFWSCPRHSAYTSYIMGNMTIPMSFYLIFQEFSILRTIFLAGDFIGLNEPKWQSHNKADSKKHMLRVQKKWSPKDILEIIEAVITVEAVFLSGSVNTAES